MIVAQDLCKTFQVAERAPGLWAGLRSLVRRQTKDVHAVRGLSFRIEPGERVGFLGPNGAGKTTTLKMLSGLLAPSRGELRVGAHLPSERSDAFLRSVSLVLGQKQQLIWDLPPSETFELNRAIYGLEDERYRKARDELVELLQIGEQVRRPTRQLSLGERMKCELCCALLHRPGYLFLDEPTIGLDVNMQEAVRAFIRRYNEETGATLLLTSHYMADVAALCPRIIVVDKGRIIFDGALDALPAKTGHAKRVTLRVRRAASASAAQAVAGDLGELLECGAGELVFGVAQQSVAPFVARALAAFDVQDLNVTDPPLEDMMGALFASATPGADDGDAA